MSEIQDILFDDARRALMREIAPVIGRNDLQEAFAAWVVRDAVPGLTVDGALETAIKATGAERSYHHVAVLCLAAQLGDLGQEHQEALAVGLNWMVLPHSSWEQMRLETRNSGKRLAIGCRNAGQRLRAVRVLGSGRSGSLASLELNWVYGGNENVVMARRPLKCVWLSGPEDSRRMG
jgi:hypothetical protein